MKRLASALLVSCALATSAALANDQEPGDWLQKMADAPPCNSPLNAPIAALDAEYICALVDATCLAVKVDALKV